MTEWDQLAERLADQLAGLPDGAIVTIGGTKPSGPYVQSQVVQLEDSIWGEFLGDAILGHATIDAAPEVMTNVGWEPPGNADHGKNWWIELPWPIPSAIYRQLATMVVTGFRDYHRFPDLSALSYHAWNSLERNRPIELDLGLPYRELS
ncbi:TY-Chap domain-containing protein [Nocardia sp. IFM 10818]